MPKELPAYQELGNYIRLRRTASKRSLAELACKLKVTKGYLSRLERGKAKPSVAMVERIAGALDASPSRLHVLAGHLPADVKQIFYRYPIDAPAMLRETFGKYGADKAVIEAEVERLESKPKISGQKHSLPEPKDLYELVQSDCFQWMEQRAPNSIHAVVTDPPYGLKEYTHEEKAKLRNGRGGVWRIPPTFDGCTRMPLPRFTILTDDDKTALKEFFSGWAKRVLKILVPGGHVFIATNVLLSHHVYTALIEAGFEKRGEIVRLVQTLRGGDRPKNAHREFSGVTVIPRSCWEPWGLFRKPCEGRVQDNLRKWKTGGLRRQSEQQPFMDVIRSAPTRGIERDIAPHPSLKPQALMRQLVRASLPLGEGIVLDPFLGGGSTIAAAYAVGYRSIGIESDPEFFEMAVKAIPRLASLIPNGDSNGMSLRAGAEAGRKQPSLFEQ